MSVPAQISLFSYSSDRTELSESVEVIQSPRNAERQLPSVESVEAKSAANFDPASKRRKPQPGVSCISAAGEERYLSVHDVANRYAISIQTVWRHAKHNPDFPKPIKILTGSTRWRMSDILAYEAARREITP